VGSLTLPIGGVFALMGVGLVLFVLLFLRRYSDFLNARAFRISLFATLISFFIIISVVLYFNPPPKDKTRIAIFPFKNSAISLDSSWVGWVTAKMVAQILQQTKNDNFLIYPLDWILESVSIDSLYFQSYILSYAQKVKLDYVVFGEMGSAKLPDSIQWVLFNVNKRKRLSSGSIEISDTHLKDSSMQLAKRIASQLNIEIKIDTEHDDYISNSLLQWTILAEKAYVQRDYGLSIQLAEKVFVVDSNYIPVRNLLASAHLNLGLSLKSKGRSAGIHYAIARNLCEYTIQRDSLNSTAHRILGEYYLLKELWSKAEKSLRHALKINPDDARIYRDLAQLHASRLKDIGFSNEKQVLSYAIFLNPCYEEARIQLAKYYYFKRWPSRAEKEIKKLLSIYPNSIEGLLFLSKIYVSQNEILKLLETSKTAVEIAPDNADAYFNLGVAYYHWEDYDNAQAFFQHAVNLDDHINSHLYLAYIFERKGQHDRAIQHLRRRLQLRRDDLYANKARELLFQLTHRDSTNAAYENSVTQPSQSDKDGLEIGVSVTEF
jgi:Tfp pilus assembly protein PilF